MNKILQAKLNLHTLLMSNPSDNTENEMNIMWLLWTDKSLSDFFSKKATEVTNKINVDIESRSTKLKELMK